MLVQSVLIVYAGADLVHLTCKCPQKWTTFVCTGPGLNEKRIPQSTVTTHLCIIGSSEKL